MQPAPTHPDHRALPPARTARSRYAALVEMGAVLADVDDLDQLGQAYIELAGQVMDFPMRAVYIFGPDGATAPTWYAYQNVSARYMTTYERRGRAIDLELREALTTRAPVYNLARRSVQQWRETEIYRLVDRIENMLHVLKAPVVVNGTVVGTVDFASDRVGAEVGETDMDLLAGLARTVGGAVTALRRRQELQEQLAIQSLALETSSAAMVWFTTDRAEPTITPSAAGLLSELQEGADILYRILRDTGVTAESRRSYLVRLRNGAKDVLDCMIRAVPGQPGAEVLELSLETNGIRYVDDRLGSLSPREHDVADLVAAGLADREIADRLTLSLYTVRQHVKSIYTKLEISNRVQLTRVVLGRTARIDAT